MKKMNRKGFTIVELVIVIAVIAILAGVLIPTFSGIVKKAQESAALQEAAAAYKEAYALAISDDGKFTADEKVTMDNGFVFTFNADGTVKAVQPKNGFGKTVTVDDGQVKIGEACATGAHDFNGTGEGDLTHCEKCGTAK